MNNKSLSKYNVEQWQELSARTNEVRNELSQIMADFRHLLTQKKLQHLEKAYRAADIFRDAANGRMYDVIGDEAAFSVVYGGHYKPQEVICSRCHCFYAL
ncbi:hypothetical protein [Paenibacillus montanisoli]|uniref:Uncharacterized protein n=1 Tax=Paenibacillus montanisoli TaxID=2081970 RepID=A0A328U3H1_9BACL|nr:hypothetical protein [Paenibacillus montanisoli]RAP77150.1 hypothetical protein DL346_01205 [Paenibacillus montanisoli]